MNRTSLLLTCFFLTCASLYAQDGKVMTSGVVLDGKDGSAVAGVIVAASRPESGEVLSYALTDDSGSFALHTPSGIKELAISASSLMTEKKDLIVSAGTRDVKIHVKMAAMTIKEVKVTADKITMRGDTLDFNVASYAVESDRSIGDIIRKLPGLNVDASGKIYFQGQEISGFYVEGMDLLKGRYGIATQNITPDMVASVQVLQNHQPIKVLKGVDLPEDAAINLKLRSSAVGAMFLNAQVGAGVPFGIMSNELLGMRFTKENQDMILLKNDNSGRDISRELTSFYGVSSSPVINPFSIGVTGNPSIDQSHYLFNNAYTASVNNMRLIGKDYVLTSSLTFMYDTQSKTGRYQQTVYAPGQEVIDILEEQSAHERKRELSATVTLEKNTGEMYLSNRTDANMAWNGMDSMIDGNSHVEQNLSLPSFSIENHFRGIKGRNRWTSSIAFSNQHNDLKVSPSPLILPQSSGGSLIQELDFRHFMADAGYSRELLSGKNWHMRANSSIGMKNEILFSHMVFADTAINADSLKNNLSWNEVDFEIGGEFNYSKEGLSLAAILPVRLRVANRDMYVVPEPYGHIEYRKRRMTYRMDLSYRKDMPGITDLPGGYMMNSYRLFSRNDGMLPITGRTRAQVRIAYKSVGEEFFASASGGYTHSHLNTLSSMVYSGTLCRSTRIEYANDMSTVWGGFELGVGIPILGTTLKLEADIADNAYTSMIQNAPLDCHAGTIYVRPSVFTLIGSFMTMEYEAAYTYSRSQMGKRNLTPIHNLHQKMKVVITPVGKFDMEVSCDHYHNSVNSIQNIWFCNAALKYRLKKVEFLLDWTNCFNMKTLSNTRYNEAGSISTSLSLRPSEVLLRARFKIGRS